MMLLVMMLTATTAWAWTGSGTSASPFQIANASDLATLRDNVNNGTNYENTYFEQTYNITLSGTWTPIGQSESTPFKGHYNGAGYKISGLTITASGTYIGLFSYVRGGSYAGTEANTHIAEVHGVVLENPSVTITASSDTQYAGALVGWGGECSRIYDCTVIGGTVSYTGGSNYNTNNSYAGGLVGIYSPSNFARLSGNKVSGTTVSGGGICGGLVGFIQMSDRVSNNNIVDANISSAEYKYTPPSGSSITCHREGAVVGYCNTHTSTTVSGNYYHSATGLNAFGSYPTYDGSAHVVTVDDPTGYARIYTVSSQTDGLALSGDASYTIGTARYYVSGATATLTLADADKAIKAVSAPAATSSSVATDHRTATITVGTSDVTVSATLLTIGGSCGNGLTWHVSDTNSDGTYETLNINYDGSGTGVMDDYAVINNTYAPWYADFRSSITTANIADGVTRIGKNAFYYCTGITSVTLPASVTSIKQQAFSICSSLARVNIGKTDGVVTMDGGNAFTSCAALAAIVVPTPALALQYATANKWTDYATKIRTEFGGQLFSATNEGGTPAYKIATADDLRNLVWAVNAAANISSDKTFRQTADIDLNDGKGNFTPIGFSGGNWSFKGTYDGGSHTISGLTVSDGRTTAGLFGSVYNGTVKNVILVSPSVTSTANTNSSISIGALAGYCERSTIVNCHVVNPTVSATGTGSGAKKLGALFGEFVGGNTAINCYYYGGNQSNAKGYGSGTLTNVSAAHLVNLGNNVTIQTEMAANLGFSCDSDNDDTPENYWRTGAELTLADLPTDDPGQGYHYAYIYGGNALSGTTLTIGNQDATVALNVETIDWATQSTGDDAEHAYMIYNKDQLLLLAYRVNGTHGETLQDDGYSGKYFKLGADIEFTHADSEGSEYDENYEAIGGWYNMGNRYFKGNFDGDGHTVSGIRIRKEGTDATYGIQGLFGETGNGANIHHVHLTDARIKGYSNIGGIVGYNYNGTVSRCVVTDSYITATGNNYGTICGFNNGGTLENNYYHGCTVNGTAVTSDIGCYGADITNNDGAVPMPALSDNTDNTTAIATLADRGNQGLPTSYPVVLDGRTLYKDGAWNTIVLPFAVSNFTGTPLEGATVKELLTTSNLNNGTLTLNFSNNLTAIEAGKPYIVKWDKADNIENPVFTGVTVSSTTNNTAFAGGTFKGTYSPVTWTEENKSILFLGDANTLFYPEAGASLGACRAYFELSNTNGVREFVMNFGEESSEATGILNSKFSILNSSDAWYTINGVKLDKEPTKPGLYIYKGKKVVIK